MQTILFFLFIGISFLSSTVSALTVNRVNGGANIIYIDFSVPGSAVPLELVRAYNSITAFNEQTGWSGSFGWGWTSPFETTLITTPDRSVILRDGGTGNTITFRTEKEDPKVKEAFYANYKRAYFESKTGKKLSSQELQKLQLPQKNASRLRTDPQFRASEAQRLGIKGVIPKGELLISSEYGYQTIQFKNNQWIREKDGITQIFDKEGRLVKQVDKNNFYFDFKYANPNRMQVSSIADQDKGVSLKFSWRNDRIVEILDNRGHKARYNYDAAGNLVQVIDSNNQAYGYRYENRRSPHLLTRIDYLSDSTAKDKVYREIKYDDAGLVTYHRDKDGAEFTYQYGRSTQDPENNFSTKVAKKFRGKTEEMYDEYTLKARPDGTKFLYRQESRQNGATTVTVFTACCGKPSQIVRNGQTTNFKYSEDGLLIEKVGPGEDIRLAYDPTWKKVSQVIQNGVTSKYEYDSRGNLVRASNTKNEKVALKYDKIGRITEMTDPEGKQINFKYGNLGKPTLIAEKNVGTIRIEYDPEGRILKTETIIQNERGRRPSDTKSQEVIKRVMKSFQHLLDIIRPAGVSMNG